MYIEKNLVNNIKVQYKHRVEIADIYPHPSTSIYAIEILARAYIFDLAFTNLIFRENNTFIEKVTKELISRNIFSVRKIRNFFVKSILF